MVEACQAKKPDWRRKSWSAIDDVLGHEDFVTVEDDASDVTTNEHNNNTDDYHSKIDFFLDRLSIAAVRKP